MVVFKMDKEKQVTWAIVKNTVLEKDGYTVDDFLKDFEGDFNTPKHNRTVTTAFDRAKLDVLLRRNGFERSSYFFFDGDVAIAYVKDRFKKFIELLIKTGFDVVEAQVVYVNGDTGKCDICSLGDLDDSFGADEVVGLEVTLRGTKHCRLSGVFEVSIITKIGVTHHHFFSHYIDSVEWDKIQLKNELMQFMFCLKDAITKFDVNEYMSREYLGLSSSERLGILEELKEDKRDLLDRCDKVVRKLYGR